MFKTTKKKFFRRKNKKKWKSLLFLKKSDISIGRTFFNGPISRF